MTPRIETAEILSFRLKIVPAALERLPSELGQELNLTVEPDGAELVLSMEDSDSYLRFRPIGTEAMLTEIFLCNDDRGLFFQRVLGALMVRYGGDLHIRLTWNTPERNSHGDFAEVRINRGSTTYPGLANTLTSLPPPLTGGAQRPGSAMAAGGQDGEAGPTAPEEAAALPPSPQEKEVLELLAKAKAHWAEYQRLKSKKG